MELIEIIAFLILLVVALFSVTRRASPEEELLEKIGKKREEAEGEEGKELEKLFQVELPPSPPFPLPKPLRKEKRTRPLQHSLLQSPLEKRQRKTKLSEELEKRSSDNFLESLLPHRRGKSRSMSRIEKKREQLPSLQDLVIYQEIINRPKSLRE